jgi:hypothetical protein
MVEIVVKIMMELISTLALVTEELRQRRSSESSPFSLGITLFDRDVVKFLKKTFFGAKDIEAVMCRLDRLTQDEAQTTATQTFGVIHSLIQSMKEFVDSEQAYPSCNPLLVGYPSH